MNNKLEFVILVLFITKIKTPVFSVRTLIGWYHLTSTYAALTDGCYGLTRRILDQQWFSFLSVSTCSKRAFCLWQIITLL